MYKVGANFLGVHIFNVDCHAAYLPAGGKSDITAVNALFSYNSNSSILKT